MSDQLIDRKYAQYQQLLNGIQKKDPRLFDVLQLITKDIKGILDVVDPIKASVDRITSEVNAIPLAPTVFIATINKLAITFVWSADDPLVRFYELRKGSTWELAEFVLRTSSLAASIPPITAGSHTYLLKTLSGSLTECENALPVTFTINAPQAPSVTTQVIDNNVLISWSEPSSDFAVDFYNVYKDGVKFAELSGTFTAKFEVVSGTYVYSVEAVDIAGNAGTQGSSQATVRQPPDYNLLDVRDIDWSLGTKTNCYAENGYLIACVDLTETFEDHFISRSWSDPDDQVTAGYDRYIQENPLTGSYSEDYDYGVALSNVIVNYNYVKEIFSGTNDVSVVVKTYYKVNVGDSWTGPLTGTSAFINSFRYLRSVLEFTATDADSMISLSSYSIRLDVKREVDSGYVSALASDTNGTVVYFNKSFKDVDAITGTSDSGAPITVIFDFADVPNPTTFKVFCFDSSGNRVDQLVYWVARGIV